MKHYKGLLVFALAAVMLAGCGKKEEAAEPVEEVQEEPEEEVLEAEDPDVEAIPEGQVKSYLTGEYVPEEIGTRRPVAVMLNNIQAAVPQAGIAKAGVVYEAPVEGNITRLMGIFEDYDDLDKIGSVRSCRTYYIYFAREFDAIYTHFGQAVYAVEHLNRDGVDNISGLAAQKDVGPVSGYAGEGIFYRTTDRKAPHNCYTSAEGIAAAIEKNGYRTQYADDYTGHYQFAKVGESVNMDSGYAATYVSPHYAVNDPWFEYDEETGLYKRFQYGAAQIDQLTDEQLTYKNIIIQNFSTIALDDHGYLDLDCIAGGTGIYITDGKAIDITWKKDSEWGPSRYYDADGNEITLNTGKTWVCAVNNNDAGRIEVRDINAEPQAIPEAEEVTGTEETTAE
ncbi:MAG: DUF3048 domain-containing protein [Lachnospiraceae bacterium]|jgi:hypothetical protein